MKWIRETFSDGDKPSLSRQLALFLVLVYLGFEIAGLKPTQHLIDLIQGAFTWAFGSGAVSKGKDIANAVMNKVRKPEEPQG